MANVTERRAARMRKILENSDRRLEKITGVQNRSESYILEGYRSPQNTLNAIPANNGLNIDVQPNNLLGSWLPLQDDPYTNDLFNTFSTNPNSNLTHSSCRDYRDNNSYLVNNVFIPLICFEIVDLFHNRNKANQDTPKYMSIFRSIPKHQLVNIMKCFNIIRRVFQDIMIYFFVFICMLYLRNMLIM